MDSASFPANHARSVRAKTMQMPDAAISRTVVGQNVYSTIPKGNMGYDQYTVPDTAAVEPLFIAFLSHSQTYVHGLSCHSFKFRWSSVNSKPPTIPFGIVAGTFSENRSRKSTRLVISLEYPHSLTATFCFPELFRLITSLCFFFFQSKPWTPSPSPWGESSGGGKRKGDQFYNCLHTKVSV